MGRWLRGIAAVPLVVLGVSVCGVCIAAGGMLLETTLRGQPVAIRWLILGGVLAVATGVLSYGFRAGARRFARLPSQWLQALSDAVLLIGGLGCLVGALFLILSLMPGQAFQKYPLRASGGVLLGGSALLVLLRVRASRSLPPPPAPPRPARNAAAQAVHPEEAATVVARNP
jgi:hypothetical protein